MTTVGLELTNFIDPSLTWKTVSKGRNTSRRSRRSVSTTSKLDQKQGRKNLKRLSGTQSSESDKSDISIQGRGFGNMEHIPIKKRRFLLRSPSPPPQSPNHHEESQELESGRCTLDPQIYCNGNTEPELTGIDISSGSVSKKNVLDGSFDNTASSFNRSLVSNEDFSGIAILAAAACSGGLDFTKSDFEKSKMGVMLKREDDESFASATKMKDNIAVCSSTNFSGKATGQLKEDGCVADLPSNRIQTKNTPEDGRSQISEVLRTETNKSVVSAINRDESAECCGSPDAASKVALSGENSPFSLPNNGVEIADKTMQHVGVQRDFRLHWDLNTVMDDWENPVDDTFVDSCAQSVEIASTSAMRFQKPENVEASTPPERHLATQSGDAFLTQPVACSVPESKASADCGGLTRVNNASNKSACSLYVSSDLVRTRLEGSCSLSGADNNAIKATSNHVMESKTQQDGAVAKADSDIGHSLSLGMNETMNLVMDKGRDTNVAEKSSLSTLQTEVHAIDFSLLPLPENTSCEIKVADCVHSDSKERNALDESVMKGAKLTCQAVSTKFLGVDKSDITALGASLLGKAFCKADDTNSGDPRPLEHMKSLDANDNKSGDAFFPSANSQSSGPTVPIVDFKDSNCSSNLEAMVSPSATNFDKQVMDMVIAKKAEENSCTSDASRGDHRMEIVPNVAKPLVPLNPTGNLVKHLGCNTPENHGGRDSHISSEVSSQVTENNANVTSAEGGYDSHLEDGELRESVGHYWEDHEGEDAETEHVDYDSDNREGIFYEAANDFAQLSGEVLAEDFEKQSCHLEKFSDADVDQNVDKSVEENCSLQHQNCLLTADAKGPECSKLESPVLKSCSKAQLKAEVRVEGDGMDCASSGVEADVPGKEYEYDALRNCRGASASGRELQFSERRSADPIRRSRSSNFDGMLYRNGSGEPMARRQPAMQTDRFGGRSWDTELPNAVTDSVPKEEGEKTVPVSEDTSPRVCRPRIISTSRSGYNLIRRESPVERDNSYGMGMPKGRDISPDNNSRSRFDRFSNGINRGFREGYRRPSMYEGGKSNGPMLNHFGKRERSFSPMENRLDSHYPRSYRKSRSRSRTRSPDFRSEARMGRTRLPYQQPGHAADHIRERRSPVRGFNQRQRFDTVGSPGRLRSDDCMRPMMRPVRFHETTSSSRDHDYEENDHYRRKPVFMRNNRRSRSRSRSCSPDFRPDSRMGPMRAPYQSPADHTRGRRSPVRVFRPGQRYDNGESGGRLRSDDCMRPIMRPGRFNDTSQPGSRGDDYNNGGDEYRRKPRNIFERIHPVRHYDGDGDGRRFQYSEQDNIGNQNFRRNENYTRGGDRRPEQFRREDRGNVRYNNNSDRMFYSGPKQFGGMRDYADDTLPRGVRP